MSERMYPIPFKDLMHWIVTERANTFWIDHITVRQHAYEILRGEYTLLEDELGL